MNSLLALELGDWYQLRFSSLAPWHPFLYCRYKQLVGGRLSLHQFLVFFSNPAARVRAPFYFSSSSPPFTKKLILVLKRRQMDPFCIPVTKKSLRLKRKKNHQAQKAFSNLCSSPKGYFKKKTFLILLTKSKNVFQFL